MGRGRRLAMGVGAVGLLFVVLVGLLRLLGDGGDAPTSAVPGSGASGITSPSRTAGPRSTPSSSATTSPSTEPAGYLPDPAAAGLHFGLLTGVATSGSTTLVTYQPARYLVGADASAYYAAHPDLEPLDFAMVEQGALAQAGLAPGARLFGNQLLGPGNGTQVAAITAQQLAARSSGPSVPVWLRFEHPTSGRVVYLAEQYSP